VAFWSDKHVFITGGSSGIGLAVGQLVAARGAHVTLVARDPQRLEAARESVRAACASQDQKVLALSASVEDWDRISTVVQTAEAFTGPIDVLVTSAGYCYPARFADTSPDELRSQVEVNLVGTLMAARAVVPSMIARRSGHIAMLSSAAGLIGVYGYGGYSPAKFGVIGLGEVLRNELKPDGVGVSVICPPNVDTPGYAREIAIEPAETAKINGTAQAWSPEAIGDVVLRAIERRRFMSVPGFGFLRRIKGLVPEVFYAVIDRNVASVRRGGGRA
jgi:3-dehydrosphinganine reductase